VVPLSRIDAIFAELRQRRRKALMPFVCAGHPRAGDLSLLLPALERGGANIVEVGIPFSDPIADGPVIAAAMHKALTQGTTPEGVFEEIAAIREWLKIGLVAMVSASIVYRLGGPGPFIAKARRAGFDGLIVPDLPLEEAGETISEAKEQGISLSLLISPSTPLQRAESIVKASTGFVYLLARAGITGEREQVPDISGRISRLRQMTQLPIAVGFGISRVEQVRAVVQHADAAIVGSALVRRLEEAATGRRDPIEEAEAALRELSQGLG
jgi:tryptophan synthase alpha chain